jgi:hypothetical protein
MNTRPDENGPNRSISHLGHPVLFGWSVKVNQRSEIGPFGLTVTVVGAHVPLRPAAEPSWHVSDRQGQIMALAPGKRQSNLSSCSLFARKRFADDAFIATWSRPKILVLLFASFHLYALVLSCAFYGTNHAGFIHLSVFMAVCRCSDEELSYLYRLYLEGISKS